MTDNQKPFISVVVACHNQPKLLEKLLVSLEQTRGDIPLEAVVTDDGSNPPIAELVAGRPWLTILRHERSKGAAAARNYSAAHSQGEVLFFLDSDTILCPGTLATVYQRFCEEPDLGAVNGGAEIDPANPEDGFTPCYRALLDYVTLDLRAGQSCTFFTPRCGAIRRELFERAGAFDDGIAGATVEEYEFGHRLSQIQAIRFDSRIRIRHHYADFHKNNWNYFYRVRLWMNLFTQRRQFEDLGACTQNTGWGSVLGAMWVPALLLRGKWGLLFWCASLAGLLYGYSDVLYRSLRLKGPWFALRATLLTLWLCVPLVCGAAAGVVDYLRSRRVASRSLS